MEAYGRNNRFNAVALAQDRHISVPCLAFCVLCALIFGYLPALSPALTKWFRPLYIGICILFTQKSRYRISWASLCLILLHVYLTVSLIAFDLNVTTFTGYFAMVLFVGLFVFAETRFWTRREIVMLLNVIVLACTIYAFLMLRENESLRNMEGVTHLYLNNKKINRNTVAFAIVPGSVASMICLMYGAWKKSRWKTIYYAFTAAFCLYTIFCTGGRSAFYSAAFGDFLVIWETIGKSPALFQRTGKRILILASVALALLVVMNLVEGSDAAHIFNLRDSSGRDEIWDVGWQLIREKPIFGGGFAYWETSGLNIGTHNNFITIMVCSGWVGGILFGLSLGVIVLELWSCRNYALMAFPVELLCHAWTEPGMDYFAYIPLCLAYMLYRYMKNVDPNLRTLFE